MQRMLQEVIPKMADLPPGRLRLQKPPFYSTGMGCFGPFHIKIGRCCEKRWGIIFKCLTTRCVYLDLLTSIYTDSFLMALRRFVACHGRPCELLSDQGTNVHGGKRELQKAFASLSLQLQQYPLQPTKCPTLWWFLGRRDSLCKKMPFVSVSPSPSPSAHRR